MARLSSPDRTLSLASRAEVGRSPGADVRIDDRLVSGMHARIFWTGDYWAVRDLGSTNGTFVNDRRLQPGKDRALALGDSLAFGRSTLLWQLDDLGAPEVRAVRLHDGFGQALEDGCLALPSDDDAVAILRGVGARWILERETGDEPVVDQQVVVVAGEAWRVELPTANIATWKRTDAGWAPEAIRLVLRVSRDREYIEVSLRHRDAVEQHPHRAHHELLLVLAEARLEDVQQGEGKVDAGWRDTQWLCRALGLASRTLNLHVHRARRRMQRLEVMGMGGAIERRMGTGQLRLSLDQVEITTLH
jgi:hypothetical protein